MRMIIKMFNEVPYGAAADAVAAAAAVGVVVAAVIVVYIRAHF